MDLCNTKELSSPPQESKLHCWQFQSLQMTEFDFLLLSQHRPTAILLTRAQHYSSYKPKSKAPTNSAAGVCSSESTARDLSISVVVNSTHAACTFVTNTNSALATRCVQGSAYVEETDTQFLHFYFSLEQTVQKHSSQFSPIAPYDSSFMAISKL